MPSKTIVSVSIPSKWGGLYDSAKEGVALFRTGEGPCGKTVTRITVDWKTGPDRLIVRQFYETGDCKDFVYMIKDLTGRVKIAYK